MIYDVKGYKLNKDTGNYEEVNHQYEAYADEADARARLYTAEWGYDLATVTECCDSGLPEVTYYARGKIVA